MPALSTHPGTKKFSALLAGNSGTGKSGAIPSLIKLPYITHVFVLDFDNGLDIWLNLLSDEDKAKVFFKEMGDDAEFRGDRYVKTNRMKSSFAEALKAMDNWVETDPETGEEVSHGGLASWDEHVLLVIDSLTFMSQACHNYVLNANGRFGAWKDKDIRDYLGTVDLMTSVLERIASNKVKCNFIATSHVGVYGAAKDGSGGQPFPNMVGQKLARRVGGYFNTILGTRTTKKGPQVVRQLLTEGDIPMELKHVVPGQLPAQLPIETGLAQVFKQTLNIKDTKE